MIFDRPDPEAQIRAKERQLLAKRTERNIYGAVLDLHADLRFQRYLELVADYRRQCLEQMVGEAVSDLRELGIRQGRVQGIGWLVKDRDSLVRLTERLDSEIQVLEHDIESAHKPLSERMADTTRRTL
jgi:hypothetical protein